MQVIEYIEIDKLKINDRNPRTISETELNELVTSIKDDPGFFETRPILCTPDMVIYAGTMRMQAAKKLGWTKVPVAITDVDSKIAKLRMLKDNRHRGDDNWDILINDFDVDELLKGGFKKSEIDWRLDRGGSGGGEGGTGGGAKTVICPECGHEFTPKKFSASKLVIPPLKSIVFLIKVVRRRHRLRCEAARTTKF